MKIWIEYEDQTQYKIEYLKYNIIINNWWLIIITIRGRGSNGKIETILWPTLILGIRLSLTIKLSYNLN